MKIALAQLNFMVGDIVGNAQKIENALTQARGRNARLLITPELSLLGYPPKDLLLKGSLIAAQVGALKTLARQCRGIGLIIGWAEPNKKAGQKPLFNSASLLEDGRVAVTHRKVLLPYYDVFDEERYFEPGRGLTQLKIEGYRLALSICEDIWNDKSYWKTRLHPSDPLPGLRGLKAGILVNISASPYWAGKPRERRKMFCAIARRYRTPIAYCNSVGGNDELLFDGSSMMIDAQGRLLTPDSKFKEEILFADFPPLSSRTQQSALNTQRHSFNGDHAELYDALVMGLRDYVHKCGFSQVTLGLSGGIDSSLVACLAADALGPENVFGLSMPGRFSTDHSLEDAGSLTQSLGIKSQEVSIEPVFMAYLEVFARMFPGLPPNVTEENIQARIRGALLMAVSNKLGHMVLSTGNKSEIATGYCTLYGDLMGGLAPISDLPKMLVYRLARYRNAINSVIPERVFTKPPSAELRPNQTDQDTLTAYEILDKILEAYIVEGRDKAWLEKRFPKSAVRDTLRRVDANEFKRRQAPPGLKVSRKAFGSGRRMPIACRTMGVDGANPPE